jgi:hypothetical protein
MKKYRCTRAIHDERQHLWTPGMVRIEENNYNSDSLSSHFELIEQTDVPSKPKTSFDDAIVEFAKRHKINKTTLSKIIKDADATNQQEQMAALASYVERRK